jgi:hypothetical protein
MDGPNLEANEPRNYKSVPTSYSSARGRKRKEHKFSAASRESVLLVLVAWRAYHGGRQTARGIAIVREWRDGKAKLLALSWLWIMMSVMRCD